MKQQQLISLDALAKGFIEASLSPNTRRSYKNAWNKFTTWCSATGEQSLPASAYTVSRFVTAQATAKKSAATIGIMLAAIKKAHIVAGHNSPTDESVVKAVVTGIRRSLGTSQKRKSPITASKLQNIVPKDVCSLASIRNSALLSLGFACALRRSEIAALCVADLEFNAKGLLVTVRRSKTDQDGKGFKIAVPNGNMDVPGKVKLWLIKADITTGPLFRRVDRWGNLGNAALSHQAIVDIIKANVQATGTDPKDYSGHSLRSGLITSAAEAGANLLKIMDISRHTNVGMVRRYVRDADMWNNHAASSFI